MYAIIEDSHLKSPATWKVSERHIYINFSFDELVAKPEDYYIVDSDNQVIQNPDFEAEQAIKRKAMFEAQFMETSYKKGKKTGWYRQVPKGYSNAPQSIEIIDKYVQKQQGLTEQLAAMIIFYPCPDFTKAEQCTEEWLIAHQFNPDTMTLEQWDAFMFDFDQRWAFLNYRKQLAENS